MTSWMIDHLPPDEQVINLPGSGKLLLKKRKKFESYNQDLVGTRLEKL